MAGRLAGKIACVTGIGAGIGQGIALMFAREGATVIGCDINPERAAATVAQAAAEGLTIDSVHPCDLTKADDVRRYIEHAAKEEGRIDILVNAAAIAPHMNSVAQMDYEREWVPTMVGEVDIVFLACKAAWPHLLASGAASIINFASVNAFRGSINFGMAAHCAGVSSPWNCNIDIGAASMQACTSASVGLTNSPTVLMNAGICSTKGAACCGLR